MTYGIATFKDVLIPTRDGVRLATDIHRPTTEGALAEGQFPIILCRTSYDKSAQRYVDIADYFTPRGYVVALQDFRGRGRSEGTGQYYHTVNPHEGRDGYDTIEWLAAQPWSNGRVGMVGSSHPGVAQVAAALYRPPHLAALWPDVTPINMYDHQSRRGGAMALQMFGALFVHALDAQELRDNPAGRDAIVQAMTKMRELVWATPFKPGHTPLAVVPALEETLINYYTRGDYDEYWAQECNDMQRALARHADVPMTLTGGWYDLFANATPVYWATMRAQNESPARLVMGPWNHTAMRGGQTVMGDVDLGPEAAWGNPRYFAEQLRFFDRWLKDQPTGVENDPPVQIFVMGGGSGRRTQAGHLDHGGAWRAEQEFPLARTQWTPFYLRGDGGLSLDPAPPIEIGAMGRTADDPPARAELTRNVPAGERPAEGSTGATSIASRPPLPTCLTFTYDPAHPVPTIGASSSGLMEIAPLGEGLDEFWGKAISPWARLRSIVMEGAGHQAETPDLVGGRPPYRPLAERPDVLVFQTEPLAHDVEVTGPITVHLWVSSSAPDTDFTAKLVDVYPPNEDYPAGYHLNLVDSILRCRYRDGWDKPALMQPGQIYPIQIDLAPTSNLFKAGHRLRLDISSSNFPRFDRNPNTGEPMGRHSGMVPARNTVYLDAEHPSHVVLPVVSRQ